MRAIASVAALLLLSCRGSDGSEDHGCDEVADRMVALCGAFAAVDAERVRHDCEALGPARVNSSCILRQDDCAALETCEIPGRTWGCSDSDDDCLPGLRCNPDLQECVACFTDDDCEPDRFCFASFCIEDTPDSRRLEQLVAP